jgi:PadR family transcriptional regulator PadR
MSEAQEENLGELEQMVLLVVLRIQDNAYGVTIIAELEAVALRGVSRPAVYLALARLPKKSAPLLKAG